MQLAQTPTMMMRNDRGGDGDDSATFHLFGAAFLNPGCTLESPQVFCLFVCFVLNTLSEPHPKRVILELYNGEAGSSIGVFKKLLRLF